MGHKEHFSISTLIPPGTDIPEVEAALAALDEQDEAAAAANEEA